MAKMKYVAGFAALIVAAVLAWKVAPHLHVEARYKPGEYQAAKESIAPSLIGQLQMSVSDLMWLKTLEYLHNGMPEHNRLHDSLSVRFWRPDKDLAVTDILRPFESELEGIYSCPAVRVHNYSRNPATFTVTCRMRVHSDSVTVTDLPALTATFVEFSPVWVAGTIEFLISPCDSF